MRKLIASINMSLDGFCDHTAMTADDELHQHYNDVLRDAGTLVYGRITYQLMESYWPAVVQQPTGNEATDAFGVLIDKIEKVVFSRTLTGVSWQHSSIAQGGVEEVLPALKQQDGKPVLVGSPSMIVAAMQHDLVDEYQLCVHPTIVGKGLRLLRDIHERIDLQLIRSKTFASGAIVLYYQPVNRVPA